MYEAAVPNVAIFGNTEACNLVSEEKGGSCKQRREKISGAM